MRKDLETVKRERDTGSGVVVASGATGLATAAAQASSGAGWPSASAGAAVAPATSSPGVRFRWTSRTGAAAALGVAALITATILFMFMGRNTPPSDVGAVSVEPAPVVAPDPSQTLAPAPETGPTVVTPPAAAPARPNPVQANARESATVKAPPTRVATVPAPVSDETTVSTEGQGGAGQAAVQLRAAQAKFDAKLYDQALVDLKAMVAAPGSSASVPAAYLLIGAVHERQGRLDDAQAAYIELRSRHESTPEAAEATYLMADLVLRSKRSDREAAARGLYDEVATRYPKSPSAPMALSKKAALEERARLRVVDTTLQTSVPAALVSYRTLVSEYPGAAVAEPAFDRLAELQRPAPLRAGRPDARGVCLPVPRQPA